MVSKFKTKYLDNSDNPYFISEIGINHNGILSLALQMIRESKKAGFNAVKFQKRNANDLLNFGLKTKKPIGYLSKNKNDIPKKSVNFGKWVYPDTRLELKDKDYKKIKSYCKSIKIDLIITPWDEKSMDFVENIGVKAVKVASIDANNFHFCNYIAKKRLPTIISTGMCTYDELKKTKKFFQKYKTPHMFLHCTSAYPTPYTEANLTAIETIRNSTGCEVGWSDHTVNSGVIHRAIHKWNAKVVEFHLDLDGKGEEFESGHCWLPEQIGSVIKQIRDAEDADGDGIKEPVPSEMSDRLWRTDPSDGLRPFKSIRNSFNPNTI